MLGDIERDRGNWDAAERLYRQSLQLSEELGDPSELGGANRSGIAYSIGSLGEVELERGNLALAEQYLKDAEQRFTALNAVAGVAEVNYRLMQLHRAKNNPTLAQQHYQTAHQLYSQLGAAKDLEKIEREWASQSSIANRISTCSSSRVGTGPAASAIPSSMGD